MISQLFTRSITKPKAFWIRTLRTYQRTNITEPCYFTEVSYLEACHQHHLDAAIFESSRLPTSDEEESAAFSAQFQNHVVEETYQHYKPPRRKRILRGTKLVSEQS